MSEANNRKRPLAQRLDVAMEEAGGGAMRWETWNAIHPHPTLEQLYERFCKVTDSIHDYRTKPTRPESAYTNWLREVGLH